MLNSLKPSDYGYREGMGIFSRRDGLAKTAKFKAPHFMSITQRVLWEGEQIKAWGFYSQGDDPDGFESKFLAEEKNQTTLAFGGSPHTFIAATNWRMITGYLASGILQSFPYQIADPQLEKDQSGLLLRFRDTNFEEADAEALGIRVHKTPPDYASVVPIVTDITTLPDQIIFDWVKAAMDGVIIESSYDNSTWVKIGTDLKSPFEDKRKNQKVDTPETRYFRFRYIKNDEPVGLYCDVIKVTCEIE